MTSDTSNRVLTLRGTVVAHNWDNLVCREYYDHALRIGEPIGGGGKPLEFTLRGFREELLEVRAVVKTISIKYRREQKNRPIRRLLVVKAVVTGIDDRVVSVDLDIRIMVELYFDRSRHKFTGKVIPRDTPGDPLLEN